MQFATSVLFTGVMPSQITIFPPLARPYFGLPPIEFYPAHIDKENNHFFWPCMQYVTDDESDAMLHEFSEMDRQMIHDKYRHLVEQLES
ncbi:MAG: hypothetical protein ACFE0J_06565 [Elainellaceae cyanobacterium]